MGLWAEGWVSGQDLGFCLQTKLLWHLLERGTFNFKMECYLCPTKTLPLGQNSRQCLGAAPHHWSPRLVESKPCAVSWVHPIFSIFPGQAWLSLPHASSSGLCPPSS